MNVKFSKSGQDTLRPYKVIFAFLLMSLLVSCVGQSTNIVEDVLIEVAVEPEPAVAGDAILLISVSELDGMPIDGATVAVYGHMDHEGMMPVTGETSESSNGIYSIPFEWTMGGGWILDVTVTLPDNRGISTKLVEYFVGAISQDSVINQANSENGITIRYSPDNDPASVGEASVTIIVLAQNGLPLEDATISLHATIPEHDMMLVDAESETSTNGRYVIPVSWTMAGEWEVEVTVHLDDGSNINQTFNQTIIMGE